MYKICVRCHESKTQILPAPVNLCPSAHSLISVAQSKFIIGPVNNSCEEPTGASRVNLTWKLDPSAGSLARVTYRCGVCHHQCTQWRFCNPLLHPFYLSKCAVYRNKSVADTALRRVVQDKVPICVRLFFAPIK